MYAKASKLGDRGKQRKVANTRKLANCGWLATGTSNPRIPPTWKSPIKLSLMMTRNYQQIAPPEKSDPQEVFLLGGEAGLYKTDCPSFVKGWKLGREKRPSMEFDFIFGVAGRSSDWVSLRAPRNPCSRRLDVSTRFFFPQVRFTAVKRKKKEQHTGHLLCLSGP